MLEQQPLPTRRGQPLTASASVGNTSQRQLCWRGRNEMRPSKGHTLYPRPSLFQDTTTRTWASLHPFDDLVLQVLRDEQAWFLG